MSLLVPLNRQVNGVQTQKSKKNVGLLDGWPIRKLALGVLNVRFSFLIVNLFIQMVTESHTVNIHLVASFGSIRPASSNADAVLSSRSGIFFCVKLFVKIFKCNRFILLKHAKAGMALY